MTTQTVTAIHQVSPVENTTEATAPLTVAEALQSVRFVKGLDREHIAALYANVPDFADRVANNDHTRLGGRCDLFLWHGGFPLGAEARAKGKAAPVGEYFSPNLYRGEAILRELANPTKPKNWKQGDYLNPRRVLSTRGGIGAADIGLYCVAFAEIDNGTLEEQAAKIDWLAAETGIRPTLMVLSGDARPGASDAAGIFDEQLVPGKSIHCFWGTDEQTQEQWTRIQLCLMALLGSDESLLNADRLMRYPGVLGYELTKRGRRVMNAGWGMTRVQTVLGTNPTCRAADLLTALEALCARQGVIPKVRGAVATSRSKGVGSGATGGHRRTADFSTLAVEGTGQNLLAWARTHIPAGHEAAIGFPFQAREAGDGILQGSSCRLHHEEDGRVWLHSFKTHESYFHQASYRGEEGALPGVEMISSVPHPQPRTESADDLAEQILGRSVTSEKTRAALQAERAAERAAEHDYEVAAQAQVRARMTDYWSPAEERIAARKVAAESLDFTVLAYAKRAMKLADEWRPLFRTHLASQGVVRPTEPCGFSQGLGDVVTDRMSVVHRGCGKLVCYLCGPGLLAGKAAAVCLAPVVDEDGKLIGLPMEERAVVYRYECAQTDLVKWRKRFHRAANVTDGSLPPDRDPSVTFGSEAPTYQAFTARGRAVILCTLEFAPSRKGGGGAPVATLVGAEQVRATVLALFQATYRVVSTIEDLDGTVMDAKPVMTGKITSSRGVCLNPDKVFAAAAGNGWFVECPYAQHAPQAAKTWKKMAIDIQSADLDGDSPSLVTTPVSDPERRQAAWEAVASTRPDGEPYARPVVFGAARKHVTVTSAATLDAMLSDLDAT
jgi:hypothetical protein